jgi:hypothetical protein
MSLLTHQVPKRRSITTTPQSATSHTIAIFMNLLLMYFSPGTRRFLSARSLRTSAYPVCKYVPEIFLSDVNLNLLLWNDPWWLLQVISFVPEGPTFPFNNQNFPPTASIALHFLFDPFSSTLRNNASLAHSFPYNSPPRAELSATDCSQIKGRHDTNTVASYSGGPGFDRRPFF